MEKVQSPAVLWQEEGCCSSWARGAGCHLGTMGGPLYSYCSGACWHVRQEIPIINEYHEVSLVSMTGRIIPTFKSMPQALHHPQVTPSNCQAALYAGRL